MAAPARRDSGRDRSRGFRGLVERLTTEFDGLAAENSVLEGENSRLRESLEVLLAESSSPSKSLLPPSRIATPGAGARADAAAGAGADAGGGSFRNGRTGESSGGFQGEASEQPRAATDGSGVSPRTVGAPRPPEPFAGIASLTGGGERMKLSLDLTAVEVNNLPRARQVTVSSDYEDDDGLRPLTPPESDAPDSPVQLGFRAIKSRTTDSLMASESPEQPSSPLPRPSAKSAATFSTLGGLDQTTPLELWNTWAEEQTLVSPIPSKPRLRSATTLILSTGVRRSGDSLRTTGMVQKFISRPSSPRRIFWDFLSVLVMGYDVILIPLQVFDLSETEGLQVIGSLTTCFWSLDLLASFFAGYHTGGLIEMRPTKVAAHYLKTWFTIDILVVVIDWAVLVFNSDQVEGLGLIRLNKTLRVVRVLRVLRLLRLLRIVKVLSVMSELHDMIHSEVLVTSINVLQFIIGILLLNHYIACSWYWIGITQAGEDLSSPSWVVTLTRTYGQVPDVSYFYTSALHWSLTQFTPASMEVVPGNSAERIFTIFVLLFAVLLFSSLLSSITTSMINLRRLSSERRRQQSYVRRYITDKQVTLDLGNRIAGFLRQHNYNVSQKQSLHEDEILAFKILPESLRTQLRCEVYLPVLNPHPLFDMLHDVDEGAAINICQVASSEQELAYGQEKFAYGGRCNDMYVLVSGALKYYRGVGSLEGHAHSIQRGAFLCEAALWLVWETKGRLVAAAPCAFVAVSSASLRAVVARGRPALGLCRAYAMRYQSMVLSLQDLDGEEGLTDVSSELWIEEQEIAQRAMEDFRASAAFCQDASGGEDGAEETIYDRSPRSAPGLFSSKVLPFIRHMSTSSRSRGGTATHV